MCGNLRYSIVMSLDPERFWSRVLVGAPDICWPFMGTLTNDGYGQMQWGGKVRLAHRLAYQFATGQPLAYVGRLRPETVCVLHSCDNPACCNPSHLRLGTQGENIRDASAKKRLLSGDANPSRRMPHRLARGEAIGTSKLTARDVRTIRKRSERGDTQAEIARAYGLAISTVQRIIYRQTWRHI